MAATRRARRSASAAPLSSASAAARGVGWSLTLAAVSLLAGFFAFLPNLLGFLVLLVGTATLGTFIGAGGLGYVAVTYGYQRFDQGVMVATIIVLIVTVAVIQVAGDALARSLNPVTSRRVNH